MDDQEAIREAVGVFANENDLQAANDKLLSSGFHRAELSLVASEEAVNTTLVSGFANTHIAEDDPVVPRTAYVSPEAIADAQGGIVNGLVYAGVTAAAARVDPISPRSDRNSGTWRWIRHSPCVYPSLNAATASGKST
jgi:hypothetical protein